MYVRDLKAVIADAERRRGEGEPRRGLPPCRQPIVDLDPRPCQRDVDEGTSSNAGGIPPRRAAVGGDGDEGTTHSRGSSANRFGRLARGWGAGRRRQNA